MKIKRRKVEVKEGQPIKFTCEVTSRETASAIQWTKNELSLNLSDRVLISKKRYFYNLLIHVLLFMHVAWPRVFLYCLF